MAIGMHVFETASHPYLAYACLGTCIVATVAMIMRVVHRVGPHAVPGIGSPTNELIRHLFFVILLARAYDFELAPALIIVFSANTLSLIAPIKLPYMIRSLARTPGAVILVNLAMLAAWLHPTTTVFIAALFFGSYILSFVTGAYGLLRHGDTCSSRT